MTLTRHYIRQYLDLVFPASRNERNTFLCFKSPSLWHFIMAAGADYYTSFSKSSFRLISPKWYVLSDHSTFRNSFISQRSLQLSPKTAGTCIYFKFFPTVSLSFGIWFKILSSWCINRCHFSQSI